MIFRVLIRVGTGTVRHTGPTRIVATLRGVWIQQQAAVLGVARCERFLCEVVSKHDAQLVSDAERSAAAECLGELIRHPSALNMEEAAADFMHRDVWVAIDHFHNLALVVAQRLPDASEMHIAIVAIPHDSLSTYLVFIHYFSYNGAR